MRYARSLYLCTSVALALALAPPAKAAAPPGDEMVRAINGVRVANQLRPLRLSTSLNRSSYDYARVLMRSDRFAHAGPIPGFRRVGEMLEHHTGGYPSVGATLRRWLASPPHRAILLDPSFRYVGVGLSIGTFAGRRAAIWVGRLGT